MSTRCNIIVKNKDKETYLYHHCDGYPEGVGADLEDLLSRCERDNDFENLVDKVLDIDGGYITTHGIHGDIEYLYTITLDSDSCILKCEDDSDRLIYERRYNADTTKCKKEEILKIYKIFEEHGLIKDDLCFDPEHFIETVVIEQLNKEETNG